MTVPLVRGRRAGASVSGSPSAAAPAGTCTQGRAGHSFLELSGAVGPGHSAAPPAAGSPSPGSILEVTPGCITCVRWLPLPGSTLEDTRGCFPCVSTCARRPHGLFGLPGPSWSGQVCPDDSRTLLLSRTLPKGLGMLQVHLFFN